MTIIPVQPIASEPQKLFAVLKNTEDATIRKPVFNREMFKFEVRCDWSVQGRRGGWRRGFLRQQDWGDADKTRDEQADERFPERFFLQAYIVFLLGYKPDVLVS